MLTDEITDRDAIVSPPGREDQALAETKAGAEMTMNFSYVCAIRN
jgi:hypothetical protein